VHKNDGAEKNKKGLSSAQATILAATISAIIGPIAVYGAIHFFEHRATEAVRNASPSSPREVPPEMLGIAPAAEGSGCSPVGKLQLCWGNAAFKPRNDPSVPVCDFALTFKMPFAASPSVTTAMQGQTSGFAYAVYSQDVTPIGITGAGLEVRLRPSDQPVIVSYFAIGLPANDTSIKQ
jgi:hypothetical protein